MWGTAKRTKHSRFVSLENADNWEGGQVLEHNEDDPFEIPRAQQQQLAELPTSESKLLEASVPSIIDLPKQFGAPRAILALVPTGLMYRSPDPIKIELYWQDLSPLGLATKNLFSGTTEWLPQIKLDAVQQIVFWKLPPTSDKRVHGVVRQVLLQPGANFRAMLIKNHQTFEFIVAQVLQHGKKKLNSGGLLISDIKLSEELIGGLSEFVNAKAPRRPSKKKTFSNSVW